jgi:hypothetical protein
MEKTGVGRRHHCGAHWRKDCDHFVIKTVVQISSVWSTRPLNFVRWRLISATELSQFYTYIKKYGSLYTFEPNTKRHVAMTLTFHSRILGPECELAALHRLALRIWKWLPDFLKICIPSWLEFMLSSYGRLYSSQHWNVVTSCHEFR